MDEVLVPVDKKPHVLVIPYPAQGHINPALALAKYLSCKGVGITIVTTTHIKNNSAIVSLWDSISIASISDGTEQVKEVETIETYFKRFQDVLSKNLADFLDSSDCAAKAVIYDSVMPWVLDIAHKRGLHGASFFTQSSAVCAVYYHLKHGLLKFPYEEDTVLSLPSLPTLGIKDLPDFSVFPDPKHTVMRLLADQFDNLEKADWIFFNTFYELESEIIDWMESQWPIKTIGPTFSLLQTDEKNPKKRNHMINLYAPDHEACTGWLNSKESSSILYVSFGSIASLKKEQMEELAWGLLMSNCHFLWVVRASERDSLPENFTALASERGLLVNWCHQPQVLAHDALACFMTHGGWNSTLEALTFGVPLIAMGQWVDQTMNSKLIEDWWRIGVRIKAGDGKIVSREEIAKCIELVTQDDTAMELKRNARKWKELANKAVEKGGTSANNVKDFISELVCS